VSFGLPSIKLGIRQFSSKLVSVSLGFPAGPVSLSINKPP
jgi:hypothetical protein